MDVRTRAENTTEGAEEAVTRARKVAESKSVIPGLTIKEVAIAAGLLIAGALYYGSRVLNVPIPDVLNQQISTENALTIYVTAAGIGGFLANILASSLISTVPADTVAVKSVVPPIAIQILGAVVAASTFPSGETAPV